MSKPSTRPAKPSPEESPDTTALDEKVTDIASRTATVMQKYWRPIVGVTVAVVLGFVLRQGYNAWAEGKEASLHADLWRITSDAQQLFANPESGLPVDELVDLAKRAKGSESERFILRSSVSFLLNSITRLEASESDANRAKLERAYSGVKELALQAKTSFPDDVAFLSWANRVEETVRTKEDRSWLPAPAPVEPKPEASGSETSTPSSESGQADAASPDTAESAPAPTADPDTSASDAQGDAPQPSAAPDAAPAAGDQEPAASAGEAPGSVAPSPSATDGGTTSDESP